MGKRLAAVAVAAAAIVGLAAGPAAAAATPYYLYFNGIYSAYGEFESYGDVWTVCDMHADGKGARLYWSVPATGRSDSLSDTNGSSNSCTTQNVNIGEGNRVVFRVCLIDNGAVVYCGGEKYATA